MSDSREVPRVVLDGKHLPAPVRTEWTCYVCSFPASGMSEDAVNGAMDAHVRYINAHADRSIDPHFAERRLEALIQA